MKYICFFRMRFINGLQYRIAAAAGIATQFVWGSMEILLFRAFYRSDPQNFPMEFCALSSYIWLQQAFLALYMTWFWENELFENIRSGDIAYELCRPADIYTMWYVRTMANRLAKAALRCVPILFFAALLPGPYGISIPENSTVFLLFLISMILAFLLVASFNMLIYSFTFYTINPMGVRMVAQNIADFLSGCVIPLPFLPTNILTIVELLPFASMQNVPFRIYSGDISGSDIAFSIGLQIMWLFIFILAGKHLMDKSLKRIIIQGG